MQRRTIKNNHTCAVPSSRAGNIPHKAQPLATSQTGMAICYRAPTLMVPSPSYIRTTPSRTWGSTNRQTMLRVGFAEWTGNESIADPLQRNHTSSQDRSAQSSSDGLTIGPCFCFDETENCLGQDQGTYNITGLTSSVAVVQLRLNWRLC